jgi:alpha-glucosidase
MQWTAEPNAGFCPPDVTPWLPIAPDYRDQNVAVQLTDPPSMLSLTNHLLTLRRTHQALAIGSYRPVDNLPVACYGYIREAAGERLLIVLNFTSEPCMIALNCASCQVLLSTYLDRTGLVKAQELTLRPHEGCILHMGDSDEHA